MNKVTQILLVVLSSLVVSCAHPCPKCSNNTSNKESVRIERDRGRDDFDDNIDNDDILRRQLEQALLQQNNNPNLFNGGNNFGLGNGFNQIGVPGGAGNNIFDPNNQGQQVPGGGNQGASVQPIGGIEQGGSLTPAATGGQSEGPGPLRSGASVAAEPPLGRLQRLADPSTHSASGGPSEEPVRRRLAE